MNHNDLLKAAGATALVLAFADRALALTMEDAIENCRNTVGRPIVQACMRGGGSSMEACRARATPQVKECVQAALNKAHGRANVATPVPKEPSEPAAGGDVPAAPVAFVAPPRTIADITAILDSERPDPTRMYKIEAAADATPPAGAARDKLARFHYERGTARAGLGRLADAMADANTALEFGRGVMEPNLYGRFLQFAGLQYSAAGDPKGALAIFTRQGREMTGRGTLGYQFEAN